MSNSVLVVGGGGREAALIWKLRGSAHVDECHAAPGIPDAIDRQVTNARIDPTDIDSLIAYATEHRIALTVVGPEAPLAAGIVDRFRENGLRIFGPCQQAALVETSKVYAKRLMARLDVPTAAFHVFENFRHALDYVRGTEGPFVIKEDGLAAGKGVDLCMTAEAAETSLRRKFGRPDARVLVEKLLVGDEASLHVLADGTRGIVLPAVRDFKTLNGRNTGGMGSFGPIPGFNPEILNGLKQALADPVLSFLREQGTPYTGCLYPGVMVTADGPQVLEYNARFGDPETQVLARLCRNDFYELFSACIDGYLADVKLAYVDGSAVCVVLAAPGYPDTPTKGLRIDGLSDAARVAGVQIFHAGTAHQDGVYYTNGGRVLNVTAVGVTLAEARERAYEAVSRIRFEGMQYRDDIACEDELP